MPGIKTRGPGQVKGRAKSRGSARLRRHLRVRKKVQGSSARPRLVVTRSARNMFAQIVDDVQGATLVSASTIEKGKRTNGGNLAAAKTVGKLVAERAKEKGIQKVVFDRGGYIYHGRVKALADAAREAGLEF